MLNYGWGYTQSVRCLSGSEIHSKCHPEGADCLHCKWLSLWTLRSGRVISEEGAFVGRGRATASIMGFANGSDGEVGDGLVPFFALTQQIQCLLSGTGSMLCGFFPPREKARHSAYLPLRTLMWRVLIGDCRFITLVHPIQGAAGGSDSCVGQIEHRLAQQEAE